MKVMAGQVLSQPDSDRCVCTYVRKMREIYFLHSGLSLGTFEDACSGGVPLIGTFAFPMLRTENVDKKFRFIPDELIRAFQVAYWSVRLYKILQQL